jgi:protein TonB
MRAFRAALVVALAAVPALVLAVDQRPGVATPPVITATPSPEAIEARRLLDQLKLYADQRRFTEFRHLVERAADDFKARQRGAASRVVPAPDGPVHIGGSVAAPLKTRHVNPEYPVAARAAGVQGRLILEIVLTEQGDVSKITVLRTLPMLEQAAIDAVSQWKYAPTLLNGQPVAVVMTVTVDFAIKDGV